MLHHPNLVKEPRQRKWKPTQYQQEPDTPIEFEEKYNPGFLVIAYDLETDGLLSKNVQIVNMAFELDTVLLGQKMIATKGYEWCVYCKGIVDVELEIRPTVCHECEQENEEKEKPHWLESLVNPDCKINPDAVAIHGITDKMVEKAPKVKDVLVQLFQWLVNIRSWYSLASNFPLLLVAHNGHKFDQIILQQHAIKSKLMLPAGIYFGDTCFTIRQSFGYSWTREKNEMKLEELVKRFCLRSGYKQDHRAMLDVEALLDVLHAIRDRQDLYEFLWQDKQAALPEKQIEDALTKKQKFTYTQPRTQDDEYLQNKGHYSKPNSNSNNNNNYKRQNSSSSQKNFFQKKQKSKK